MFNVVEQEHYGFHPSREMADEDHAEMLAIFRMVEGKWLVCPEHSDYDMEDRGAALAYIEYLKELTGGRFRLVKVELTVEGEW